MKSKKPMVFVVAAVLIGIFAFAYLIATQNTNTNQIVQTSQLELGKRALRDGDLDRAVGLFSSELDKRPEDPEVHFLLGQALLSQQDVENAIEKFSAAITYDNAYTQAYAYRARAYQQLGNLNQSLEDCNRALVLDPELAFVYHIRGDIYRAQANTAKAIEDYTQALERDPTRLEAYLNRGDLYSTQRQYEQAQADYSAVIAQDPSATAYAKHALVYLAQSQNDLALADANKAIELDAKLGDAYSVRGRVYLSQANFDTAIVEFNQAISLVPNAYLAYFYRGEAYAALGYNNAAVADFTMVIEINPDYTQAYLQSGAVHQVLGDFEAALADYNAAISTDLNFDIAYIQRGLLYSQIDNRPLALEDFSNAIRLNPYSSTAYYQRADIHRRLGRLDEAINDYSAAISIDPTLREAYLARAAIYYHRQDYDNALVDYSKVIDLAPETAEAYRQRSLIYAFQDNSQLTRADRRSASKHNHQTINISIEDYDLEISRVWGATQAGSDTPRNGIFLVLEITLYNYGNKLCVSQDDFKARYQGQNINPTKLYQIREAYYPNVQYPPQVGSICLPDSRLWRTFLVYDVPPDLTDIAINFTPTNTIRTEFSLWLSKSEDSEYSFALASQDGIAITHIGTISIVEELETVLDAEHVQIENCNGQAERISTRAIAREVQRSTILDTRGLINANLGIPLPPTPYIQGVLNVEYERRFSQADSETLSYYTEETMVAPPGSIANYQITWIKVSKKGQIEIISEGETVILPFTIDHAIRADVRSLPPQSCD